MSKGKHPPFYDAKLTLWREHEHPNVSVVVLAVYFGEPYRKHISLHVLDAICFDQKVPDSTTRWAGREGRRARRRERNRRRLALIMFPYIRCQAETSTLKTRPAKQRDKPVRSRSFSDRNRKSQRGRLRFTQHDGRHPRHAQIVHRYVMLATSAACR